ARRSDPRGLRSRARPARDDPEPGARTRGADQPIGEPLSLASLTPPSPARAERDHAACATASPLKTSPREPADTTTFSPSLMRPDRMSSASGSCSDFWIARLSGLAP